MNPKLSAFFYFNRTPLILNFPLSYACIYIQQYFNMQGMLIWPVWFKLLTYPVVYYLVNYLHQKDYDFYRNMEISPRNLFLVSFTIDYLIFLIAIYYLQ